MLLRPTFALLLVAGLAQAQDASLPSFAPDDLAPPTLLFSGGKPINTEVGHAAPYLADWNGDGKQDLLVGQFGEGKLKIFVNQGSKESPKFDEAEWFESEGRVVKVPTG